MAFHLLDIAYYFYVFSLFVRDISAQTCYYPNGAIASESVPCQTNSTFSACCPRSTANDLYPFDYPNCTPAGLCKAGNSDFLARDACTDSTWESSQCSGFCQNANRTGITGLTDCGANTGWMCCDTEHDSGACSCDPPGGKAFMIGSGKTPIYFSSFSSEPASGPSSSSSSSAFPSSTTETTTTTTTTATTTLTSPPSTSTTSQTSRTTTTTALGTPVKNPITQTVYTTVAPLSTDLAAPLSTSVFAQTVSLAASSSVQAGTSAASTVPIPGFRLLQFVLISAGCVVAFDLI